MMPPPESGWPFWWRWVLATNLGWFPGILLGLRLATLVADAPVLAGVIAAVPSAVLFGAAQAYALRGALPKPAQWFWATLAGWPLGVAIARIVAQAFSLELSPIPDAFFVAGVAGAAVGATQSLTLRAVYRRWPWWIAISGFGWLALFPGAIPGAGLVWLARTGSVWPADPETRASVTARGS